MKKENQVNNNKEKEYSHLLFIHLNINSKNKDSMEKYNQFFKKINYQQYKIILIIQIEHKLNLLINRHKN